MRDDLSRARLSGETKIVARQHVAIQSKTWFHGFTPSSISQTNRKPAIHDDVSARDKGRVLAGEEQNHLRNLARVRHAAQRMSASPFIDGAVGVVRRE
jgi:hypothetical protein